MGFLYHKIVEGDTLAGLAYCYLGSAEKADQLAELNNLRYPYISDDPRAQFGLKLTEWVLENPVSAGALSFVIPDSSVLYYTAGNVLFFDDGSQNEALLINGFELNRREIVLFTPTLHAWPAGQPVEVFEGPSAHTTRVLRTGDTLAVPGTVGVTIPDQEDQFGVDLFLEDGFLRWANGDLVLTAGIQTAKTRLENLWRNATFRLLPDPLWGNYTLQMIGERNAPYYQTLLRALVIRTFRSDPWVRTCKILDIRHENDAVLIDVALELYIQDSEITLTGLNLPTAA